MSEGRPALRPKAVAMPSPLRPSRALAVLTAAAFALLPALGASAVAPAVSAAARTEGAVVWYSALDEPIMNALVERFNQLHPGIAAQALHMGSTQIPPRVMVEENAARVQSDVVSGDRVSISQLDSNGLLQTFAVSDPEKFVKDSIDPQGHWAALFSETTVIAWNPQKVRADGLPIPKSLADLGKPEWRGKLGIDNSAFNWYQAVLLTQKDGAEILKRIAENHPLLTSSHSVSITQLQAGEFDATPTAYGYLADQRRSAGQSVDFLNLSPNLVNLDPIGIVKGAPHPNAARVFVDWLMSRDAQTMIATTGHTSRRLDVPNNLRVFDPGKPAFLMPAPDRAEYNRLVSGYKALFGLGP